MTASIDIHFLTSVYKRDVVSLQAQVNYTHKSSMEIGVKVTSESPEKKSFRHTTSAYLTFVALDDNHKPSLVPSLLLKTEEKKRFESAKLRRQWRLDRKKQIISF